MDEPSMNLAMTPATPLVQDEMVISSFYPNRNAYIRDHITMAVLAMGLAMGALWLSGNPHIWTGAVAGIAAIGLRGWYMASEELSVRWDLTDRRLLGPQHRKVSLGQITKLRSIASVVQIVTEAGDKHLMKYQADPADTIARIKQAQG